MRPDPAVSVVITAYNVTPYIREALDSVMSQSFTDFEAILVNDGCPDSDNLERAIAPYRSRIVYIRQENGGPSAARNAGVVNARAPLIALLDGDDAYLPTYLEEQTQAFRDDPSLALLYPDMARFPDDPLAGSTAMDHVRQEGEATFEALIEQKCIVLNCAAIRREAILRAGMWDTAIRHAEDYDLWLRIAHAGGKIAYRRKPLARIRTRGGSLSSDPLKMLAGQLYVYEKLLRTLDLTENQKRLFREMIVRTRAQENYERGRRSLREGDYGAARALLGEANRVLKRRKLSLVNAALAFAESPLPGARPLSAWLFRRLR
jgi:glycosyltransferase involved in cell wall biosynthesis